MSFGFQLSYSHSHVFVISFPINPFRKLCWSYRKISCNHLRENDFLNSLLQMSVD